MISRVFLALLAPILLAAILQAAPAAAHPHVWVQAKARIVFDGQGRVTGVRHDWTFDEAYSAFLTQGLDANGDGKFDEAELAEIVKVNTESLSEFGYFTTLKVDGKAQNFAPPTEAKGAHDGKLMTLSFLLPLEGGATSRRAVNLEVVDKTFFVDFRFRDGEDAVTLADAPAGCRLSVTRPKPMDPAQASTLSEAFFSALGARADFGLQFANRALVACP